MIIKTDYGEYDDEDANSIFSYCCTLRCNPPELIHRTIYEFNWFVESLIWGENDSDDDTREIYDTYRKYYPQDNVLGYARLFVDYCTRVYCTNDRGLL